MNTAAEFPLKLAEIKAAMEREEWGKAIHDLENIGPIPDKFYAAASHILFFLYLSRNQFEQLSRLSKDFDPARSKDCVSALLLLRDRKLEYQLDLPEDWDIAAWEKAVESHALDDKLEPRELSLCLIFLSFLNRPQLLEKLLSLAVQAGESLDNDSAANVLRCYLKSQWFDQARRFLWINNLNNIAFDRFNFLLDRAEKSATEIPQSDDKFLNFLRHKFGTHLPAELAAPACAT